jgi:hypothetical protein
MLIVVLSVIMIFDVIVSADMLYVITVSAILLSVMKKSGNWYYFECHFAECH